MAWSVKRGRGGGGGKERVIAQTRDDARLDAEYEQQGQAMEERSERATVSTYFQKMQSVMEIQPFGCLLVVADEQGFALLAYSDNAPEMLQLHRQQQPEDQQQGQQALAIGMDARTLFNPASVGKLEKAAAFADLQLLNPLLVHCASSGWPLYAIVYRIEAGLVVEFEPTTSPDVQLPAGTTQFHLQSYKLASRAISRLQCLPGGDITLLCKIVVQEVRELTGYDRVMAYRFHDDDHGEVVAEMRRPDLEPYLGLHYPATDIPQASRFLFLKNRVRMICDCRAPAVKVRHEESLGQVLSLQGSTLRAPFGCHAQYMANMGSIASLVMAVTVSDSEEGGRRLWGLVVCHHTTPRFVPYPLRYACEFLMQVFGIQLNKELELASRLRERHIFRTQTLLCDMLLRDAPVGIVTTTPNIMDLVKCDGAALLYGNRLWLLGTTPTEAQIQEIADWLLEHHKDSTGLSTDSLAEAGFPGAASLGDAVCGMAAARITAKDFLFWFRSHTAKEIKWGGAKHDPDDKDDGRIMHPRSSFRAFLEVVKCRSTLWEDIEMDAIHSLQLILRDSFQEIDVNDTRAMQYVPGMNELSAATSEMVRVIETASVPILAVDADGLINGWNTKAAEVTGFSFDQVIDTPLIDLVDKESIGIAANMLFLALQGEEEQNVEIKLKTFGDQEAGSVVLIVNACSTKDPNDNVVGACFVAQDVTRQRITMDKYTRIQGDYRAIVQNPSPLIPPILGTDEDGKCSEWNAAMEKLSGWQRQEIIGKTLVGGVFGVHPTYCQLKSQDALTMLSIVLNNAMAGQEIEKNPFSFFDCHGKNIDTLLSANKRTDAEGRITGVFCFLHVTSPELQQALQVQCMSEQTASSRLRELAYIRQEIRNPLYGIIFTQKMMNSTTLKEVQKQILQTRTLCQQQLEKILDDSDLDSIEDGYLELDAVEFTLGAVFDAVISQGMPPIRAKGLQLICDSTEEIKTIYLFGDQLRLQQVLSEFLLNALQFTPPEGWVEIKVIPNKKHLGAGLHIMHLEFRITHPGQGIPDKLIKEMFHHDHDMSQEGLGLHICHKLVKIMNGEVQYCREAGRSSFIVTLELPSVQNEEQ